MGVIVPTENIRQLVLQFQAASQQCGTPVFKLLLHALRLRYGETRIGFSEYFAYRLYDSKRYSSSQIATFMSVKDEQNLWEIANPRKFWGLVSDKLYYHVIMEQLGFKQPRLLAFYSSEDRELPGVACLHSEADIDRFLRTNSIFPFFGKPNNKHRSRGAVGVLKRNCEQDSYTLINGETIAHRELVSMVSNEKSFLFQELLPTHSSLVEFSGASSSTLRIVVLVLSEGPLIFRVAWKIPNKHNMADNFWRSGNILAHVDTVTKKTYAVLQSSEHGYLELENEHSLSSQFLGVTPPLYEQAIELALKASMVFPMFSYQAWDIALTESYGPIALEMNHNGDIEIIQAGAKEGIRNGSLLRILQQKKRD